MSAKDTAAGEFAESLLKLLLNATAFANVADNAGSAPLSNLYLALHTSDPGASGDQTTNETSYTGYARVAVARTSAGFSVAGGTATLAANATFPTCTAGSATITHVSVGTASSGAGHRWYKGAVTPNISVSSGVAPILASGSTVTES